VSKKAKLLVCSISDHFVVLYLILQCSFERSCHDLGRIQGRLLHRTGVPIEDIASTLGQWDTKTALHYLGQDSDDMNKIMKKVAQYRKNLVCLKKGIFNTVPVRECGGTGI